MKQLSGLDTAFVRQDSPRTPMHVCAVLIYDNEEGALDLEELRQLVEQRILSLPLCQRRLQRVTLDMDTPYWVSAGETDWNYHLKRQSLPEEVTWKSFHHLLRQQHSARMDLSRPLWQMTLVDGLTDLPGLPRRSQVLILKAHHAAIDGVSLGRVLATLHRKPDETEPGETAPSRSPSQWDIWTRANRNSVSRQIKFAETMGKLLPGLMRAHEAQQNYADLPSPLRTGAQFNEQVGTQRAVGCIVLPKDDFIAIRRAVRRVTFNDIATSVVAGAMRRYLSTRRNLPTETLSCGMPINLRAKGSESPDGNQIATMVVGLATHIDDPIERLRAIHRYAVSGKHAIKALGTGTLMDISDSLPPPLLTEGIRTMAWASKFAEAPVPFHTMISNVPGPEEDTNLGPARLAACIGLGPVRDNMGLFHIISSTAERFSIAFNACSRLLPDGEEYVKCLEQSFRELQLAAKSLAR